MNYLYVISRRDGVRKLGRSTNPKSRVVQVCQEVKRDLRDSLILEYQAECPDEFVTKAEAYAQSLVWEWRFEKEWFQVDADAARQAVDAAVALAAQGGPFPKPKIERINVLLPPEMRDMIRAWRFARYIESEGEAIRLLLTLALAAEGIKRP